MREITRLLEKEDTLRSGDEYLLNIHPPRWEISERPGQRCGCNETYRRRETIEDEPRWVNVKNRLPAQDKDILMMRQVGTIPQGGYYDGRNWNLYFPTSGAAEIYDVTHWCEAPEFKPDILDPFETFWQSHKEKALDTTKEAARLIFEEARKQ